MQPYQVIGTLAVVMSMAMLGACRQDTTASPEAADVVLSFNEAVTTREELDDIVAHFAAGGVQFTLRPSHQGITPEGLTSELIAHWSGVAPILFAATSAYSRQAEILDTHVEGTVATVWTRIQTQTTLADATETSSESFTEVYMLIETPEGWKIAAIADNRQPDDIDVSQ